ncbi:hypothetical protein C8R43DRAFT_943471 [Mycena crocata]|nr:hypothetical protein C8R43DRAFT_943471 [Mycena crocata]
MTFDGHASEAPEIQVPRPLPPTTVSTLRFYCPKQKPREIEAVDEKKMSKKDVCYISDYAIIAFLDNNAFAFIAGHPVRLADSLLLLIRLGKVNADPLPQPLDRGRSTYHPQPQPDPTPPAKVISPVHLKYFASHEIPQPRSHPGHCNPYNSIRHPEYPPHPSRPPQSQKARLTQHQPIRWFCTGKGLWQYRSTLQKQLEALQEAVGNVPDLATEQNEMLRARIRMLENQLHPAHGGVRLSDQPPRYLD